MGRNRQGTGESESRTEATANATSGPGHLKAAGLVFAVGLALRLGFLAVFGYVPNSDTIWYRQIALNLLDGNGYSHAASPPFEPDLFRVPGYPAFLAVHFVASRSKGDLLALLDQSLIGALTCVLVFAMARRFLPVPGAFIAGLLAAFNPVHIHLASCLLSEVLFTFLVTAFALLSINLSKLARPLYAAPLGLLLGAAVLVRPAGIFLIPPAGLAILLAPSNAHIRRRVAAALAFVLAMVAVVGPWCYRNYRVARYPWLTAQTGFYFLWKVLKFGDIRAEDFEGEKRIAARAIERIPKVFLAGDILHNENGYSYPKISKLYTLISLEVIMRSPLRYMANSVFEFFNTFVSPAMCAKTLSLAPLGWKNAARHFKDNIKDRDYLAAGANLAIRSVFALLFFVLMPIGGYWLWTHRPEMRREQIILWSYALLSIGASALLVHGSDRMRAPFDPILLVFIAAGIFKFVGNAGCSGRARPGTRAFFDQQAERIERFRRMNRYYHREIERLWRFYLAPGDRVLEVGCGSGNLLAALDGRNGVGLDFSPRTIALAKKKYPSLRLLCSDAQNFALKEKFDAVVMSDLVGYLDDVQAAFENLHQCMTPHSRLMVNFFNHLWEPVFKVAESLRLKTPAGIQNWLSLHDVENLLHLAGYETITKGYRFLFPYNIPLISTFFNRFVAKLPLLQKLCMIQYIVARQAPSCPPDWQSRYSCSVIVPTRNEAGNIGPAFRRIPFMGAATEVIFVDGNSTDGTVEEIERHMEEYEGPIRFKLIHQGDGVGKGDAVRKGFDAASGDILMILDSDLTVPPEDLPKFYRCIATGQAELVNGCRLVYPMEEQAMRLLNYVGNKFFSVAFSWLLGQRIRDTLCGTKVLFRRDYEKIKAGRNFFGDFDPFGDFDLLFGAAKIARKIVDLPIRYRERTYGETKINRWRHGLLLLRMCAVAFLRFKLS